MGFGVMKGFTDHLYRWLRTTSSYSAFANLHKSQITTAPAKPFPACGVFTSHSLATASNSGDSSASCPQIFSSQPPVPNWTRFSSCPGYNNPTWTTQKTPLFPTVTLLLQRECVYRGIAQKQQLLQSYCLTAGVYATVLMQFCNYLVCYFIIFN
jgi:hypothetical protein